MSKSDTPPHAEGEIRDGFKFRGGSLALDFPATLAGRRRVVPRELLADPADLARWFVAAGLAAEPARVTEEQLATARELREALFRLALARATGSPLPEGDRAQVNRWAAGPAPAPLLEAEGFLWADEGGAPALLALLAREAVLLLGGSLATRIRQCSGEGCALLFVDTSRSGRRRWCSMAACGNKTKVASFRERKKED